MSSQERATASQERKTPYVIAVIPTHNRLPSTRRFLSAVAVQRYARLDVIVVDSDSSDGTPQAIEREFPWVVLLRARAKDFWPAATNIGVRAAIARGADYVLTINDDTVFGPDFLRVLVDTATRYQARLIGSRIDFLNAPGRIWGLGAYCAWDTGFVLRTGYGSLYEKDVPPEVLNAEVIDADTLTGNGTLIDAAVYAQIGFYDDRQTPHYHADAEFGLRAAANGIGPKVAMKAILYNDWTPDPSGEASLHCMTHWRGLRMLIRRLRILALSPRSHLMLKPHWWIIRRYCPRGLRARTWWKYLIVLFNTALADVNFELQRRRGSV